MTAGPRGAGGPGTDAAVAGWTTALGLPGLFDVHVHFMPPPIMARVWQHFDAAGPLIGRPWPITYRGTDDERLAGLRALGVRHFSALPYAHKPGVASFMNDWAADLAAANPDVLRSATMYPEPAAAAYVAGLLDDGVEIVKVHVQVGDFDPTDPLLDEPWGLLAEAGVPVVVHVGSGPVPGRHTGREPFERVLERHPRLTAVIAHLGMPEYAEFLDLAERFERVHLDTTMAFTAFVEQRSVEQGSVEQHSVDEPDIGAPFPRHLLPRLRDLGLGGRVLLGSDFPNIPYAYAHQLDVLAELDLGEAWLRAVLWGSAAALWPDRTAAAG